MFCPQCGKEFTSRVNFCCQCGTALFNPPAPRKPLSRSRTDRKIAGVCAGFADYLDIDPSLVRILWVALGGLRRLRIARLHHRLDHYARGEGPADQPGPRAGGLDASSCQPLAVCEEIPRSVILSGAKDLHLLLFNEELQMLRAFALSGQTADPSLRSG